MSGQTPGVRKMTELLEAMVDLTRSQVEENITLRNMVERAKQMQKEIEEVDNESI